MGDTEFATIEWSFDEESGIGRITLDRPDVMNALSNRMIDDLVAGFDEFERVDRNSDGVAVRVVVVDAAGEAAFCSGGDLEEIQAKGSQSFPGATGKGNEVFQRIEDAAPPVIAEIDGYCLAGGMELALACDFRFASERSTMGLPEVDLGIFPGSSGTQRLAQYVSPSRAKRIVMTGDQYSAAEFAADGIVDEVHPADELAAATADFARTLADRPPLAIRAIKDVVDNASRVGPRQGARYATKAYLPLLETEDHERALEAALDDRDVDWVGK